MTSASRVRFEVRVPRGLSERLLAGVQPTRNRESAVFGLASHSEAGGRTLLLIRDVVSLPDDAYVRSTGHGAKWTGASMIPIANRALAEGLGILVFHSHPGPGATRLSGDDEGSARTLLPVFQNLVPGRFHGSVVLADNRSAGLVLEPDGRWSRDVSVRLLGPTIRDLHGEAGAPRAVVDLALHDRQLPLIRSEGQACLARASVGVIGLSGGGSHVVQQLAHLGVGRIVGCDADRAAKSNRQRVIGMTWLDVLIARKKTAIMQRMVRRINRAVEFVSVPYAIPDQGALDALRQCDVIVGCLHSYRARADAHDLAQRHLIPYVDIGLLIRPIQGTGGIAIGGNVATVVPGGFCLWCIDFLSREKLDSETGGRAPSYFQGAKGDVQVVSFNGVLASQAVSEVLQLLTGFAPPDERESVLKFNGLDGTLQRWGVRKAAGCPGCQAIAAGCLIWRAA